MKIYECRNAEGHVTSFEIRNIGRSRVSRFIEQTFGSTVVSRQRSDDFGVFELNGKTFIITEPWGDNSRYLIHQEPAEPSTELDTLRSAFEKYRPSWAFSGDRRFAVVIVLLLGLIACIGFAAVLLSNR